jgi:ketosteroid isomerase-like protein
LKQALSHA